MAENNANNGNAPPNLNHGADDFNLGGIGDFNLENAGDFNFEFGDLVDLNAGMPALGPGAAQQGPAPDAPVGVNPRDVLNPPQQGDAAAPVQPQQAQQDVPMPPQQPLPGADAGDFFNLAQRGFLTPQQQQRQLADPRIFEPFGGQMQFPQQNLAGAAQAANPAPAGPSGSMQDMIRQEIREQVRSQVQQELMGMGAAAGSPFGTPPANQFPHMGWRDRVLSHTASSSASAGLQSGNASPSPMGGAFPGAGPAFGLGTPHAQAFANMGPQMPLLNGAGGFPNPLPFHQPFLLPFQGPADFGQSLNAGGFFGNPAAPLGNNNMIPPRLSALGNVLPADAGPGPAAQPEQDEPQGQQDEPQRQQEDAMQFVVFDPTLAGQQEDAAFAAFVAAAENEPTPEKQGAFDGGVVAEMDEFQPDYDLFGSGDEDEDNDLFGGGDGDGDADADGDDDADADAQGNNDLEPQNAGPANREEQQQSEPDTSEEEDQSPEPLLRRSMRARKRSCRAPPTTPSTDNDSMDLDEPEPEASGSAEAAGDDGDPETDEEDRVCRKEQASKIKVGPLPGADVRTYVGRVEAGDCADCGDGLLGNYTFFGLCAPCHGKRRAERTKRESLSRKGAIGGAERYWRRAPAPRRRTVDMDTYVARVEVGRCVDCDAGEGLALSGICLTCRRRRQTSNKRALKAAKDAALREERGSGKRCPAPSAPRRQRWGRRDPALRDPAAPEDRALPTAETGTCWFPPAPAGVDAATYWSRVDNHLCICCADPARTDKSPFCQSCYKDGSRVKVQNVSKHS
ncbi:hypothetical protein GGTG_12348 [Gaeumannomyces tritici R3-111a-1]|uniref:Uncharacterized protein n=1 Tax=Gaeumannomyces tritici (strain R3-111a-1) TaxID=644352 RepID=J3PFS3_GAET3|nr:hypothetical protein GGTG_12348 [Gaeumannomyces tritici R3-111a-1]EJT70175.1 hypothetical protein GGTG_12348 [Gaeumannomyces tritici R3-111a-1]